ncbi:AtzE family amidohydrolase [Acuticoccus sp. I52.16.1]|uniref:AtzE family amidohydrolase n=1 Tax=Acuticoccus sp. I52.16.1 TaxID=2928472 RepID=UPI001FD38042|nr:AtzE family amidohydrolase [Acuticoccus sp. I52.16.1]UOM32657.1 AtzE family amidohydrolase [Acuticoccus sp. I52.16.1]
MTHAPELATAAGIAAAVAGARVSAREVAEAALARIAAGNDALGAFTHVTAERLLAEADAVDAKVRAGVPVGRLAGVPFAVKNLYDLNGVVTLAGSRIQRDAAPATADAVVVSRLAAAGALTAGALNMGEYAYDFTGENAHDGPSRNPHDTTRMTGGSSGGSGAAVAGGLVPLALGSDTNGSIRVPSAFCGIFGMKPTYGRLPRTGTFPFVDSLDHLGPMARCVTDLALAFDAMQGYDAGDPACTRDAPAVSGMVGVNGARRALRVARLGGWFRGQGDPATDAAADRVAQALGAGEELTAQGIEAARSAAYIISNVEGAALHLGNLRTRPDDFDPATRDRLLAGTLIPGIHYVRAQRARLAFRATMRALFAEVDVLVAPTTPMRAPALGATTTMIGGEEVLLRPNIGIYTQPISFVGLPVVNVPVQVPGELPAGVQLIAPAWREDLALAAAKRLEDEGVCAAPAARAA